MQDITDRQPDAQEKAHAARWLKRIKFFLTEHKEREKRWEKARTYIDGNPNDDGQTGLVRTNLIGSSLATVLPAVYAKAPEIEVKPADKVAQNEFELSKNFATTLEVALNKMLVKDGKLKPRGKAVVRGAMTCTTGWIKVIYQRDKRTDPLVQNRINDVQDNIQRIESLLSQTEDEGECADYEAKLSELRQQTQALQKQLEVQIGEGIVSDHVPTENILILDASIKSIDQADQASAIAHRVYMTASAFKDQFGINPPTTSTSFEADKKTERAGNGKEQADKDDRIVCVWEIWSKSDMTVYTVVQGAEQWVKPPAQPAMLGERWYPLFPLQLMRVDGILYPRSFVDQLVELQDEFNKRRTNAAEHRRKNLPVRLINKSSSITDADVSRINNRSIDTDVIGIEADPNQPLQNALGSLPEIPYNPQMYDTTDILQDFEMVSGTQDAARGFINKAKTLGEAEIMQQNLSSRIGEAVDMIEDWLTEIATYSAQLLLQNVPAVVIKQKFGADAVWPAHDLSKKELFAMVGISIRAGSTAKPNKMRERDQWIQLMPQIKEAITQIADLRSKGDTQMADAISGMVDETLRRFDERMSIEDLIGKDQPGADMHQQVADLQAKLQQAMGAVQQAQEKEQELTQREADLQAQQERMTLERQLLGETQRRVIAEIKLAQLQAGMVAGVPTAPTAQPAMQPAMQPPIVMPSFDAPAELPGNPPVDQALDMGAHGVEPVEPADPLEQIGEPAGPVDDVNRMGGAAV